MKTLLGVAVLAAIVGGFLLLSPSGSGLKDYSELKELGGVTRSFQEYSTYFQQLAEKKGAEYAYEVLKRSPFPPGIDLHLLGHVVGDMLYKQQGIDGIKVCTPDFRNACSHSVVIGILNEHGEGAIAEIRDTCHEAPGGRGAYTMCFHGLGHGVLAYNEYDFEKAIPMCKKAGTPEFNNREYVECVGGMTMEMIAGVHDRDAWEKQQARFLKKDNPTYLCSASFMPEEAKPLCFIYLTPYLFEAAGMNLGFPDPQFYPKAFSFCGAIPESRMSDRGSCFEGFGKEFVTITQGRDIRNIGSTPEPALRDARAWCALANDETGEAACNTSALASLFWGGENNPDASFTFCAIAEGVAKDGCYRQLAGHISFYLSGDPQGKALCQRLPESYRSACMPRNNP
jgi:hypothetical protein